MQADKMKLDIGKSQSSSEKRKNKLPNFQKKKT